MPSQDLSRSIGRFCGSNLASHPCQPLTKGGSSARICPRPSTWPHRLEAKDIALSRRKPGFESRWGHSLQPASRRAFSCKEEDGEAGSYGRADERLRERVRPWRDARPDHERQRDGEDPSQRTEEKEPSCGG